jgi:hypothetical protein
MDAIVMLKRFEQRVVRIILLFVATPLLACAGTLIIYPPTPNHAGVLRVAEVMELVPGPELPEPYRRALLENGISDTAVRSGALAIGRVYCCGSSNEIDNVLAIFVSVEVAVDLGDVIEVRMGREPEGQKPGVINTATRVREEIGEPGPPQRGSGERGWPGAACKWIPEKPTYWNRVLHCSWMEAEGWVEYDRFPWKTWIKP